jgi:DNA helicase-2/ATP-dependent DNA helicase PcrA
MSHPPTDILEGLNPQQSEAVQHFEGPILVLAGAGSGKTRVLTSRVAHLVREHGVPPHRILAVTFTNKAAGEMRDRIRRMLGQEPSGMWVGTFHSLGARLLRRHAPYLGWSSTFTIYDADQSLRQIKRTEELLDIDPKRWNPKAIRAQLSGAKNALVSPEEFTEVHGDGFDLFLRQVAKVYPAYQQSLKDQNAFDFDDLLVKPVELLRNHPEILARYRERFAFVLVDEYQDTNHAQFEFLRLLSEDHTNLMVVGDDDQSIYGWRGADIANILGFEETFPGAAVVRLEQNYRSSDIILKAANAVIEQNTQRKGKTLRTDRSGGDHITRVEASDETDEARWIVEEIEARMLGNPDLVHRDFTILYRTNAQSRALEDAFRRRGLPYQIVGGVRFYERREIQDALAYLRLISNPADGGAFARVVNYPRRGIGAASQERLALWARAEGISLLEAALRGEEAADVPRAAARSLVRFAELIQRFSARAAQVPVGELVEELVEELDLLMHLREEGPDGEDRADNVRELVAGAVDFDAEMDDEWEGERPDNFTELDLFLQKVSLVADIDRHDPDADAVLLMTLHNAKGLEFPVVFIAGLEEGLFPLARSRDEPDQFEEERRLFYVGITRAEDKLYLTHARQRRRAGEFMYGMLSSFAEDVPEGLVDVRETPRLKAARAQFDPRPRRRGGDDLFASAAERARRGRTADAPGGARQVPPDEVDLDASMNQDLPRFVKGERVRHATFGSGAVVEVSGFGRDLKVTVDFESVGRKKLLARYANLEKDYF